MVTAEQAPLKARRTIYNGIRMRSRLEARVAAWFDSLGLDWVYEPKAFASGAGQYLPDFRIAGPMGSAAYVEVKGSFATVHEAIAVELRMEATILPSEPEAILVLGDAQMFEQGVLRVYGHPVPQRWDFATAFSLLVGRELAEICHHWRLPGWDA